MKKVKLWAARLRVLMAIVAVLCADLAFASPASAGTLTAPTWSVMDPRTNIAGNRYDYSFTTATAGTVSRVTATVPTGTSGSDRYLALNPNFGNYASTPDSTQNSVSTNLDIRARVALPSWPPAAIQQVLYKRDTSGNLSYGISILTDGNIEFKWNENGTGQTRTSAMPFTPKANQSFWIRGSIDTGQSNGTRTGLVYYSLDGVSWTAFGTAFTASGAVTLTDTSVALTVGAWGSGDTSTKARIYFASVGSGINGTTTSPSSCSTPGVVNCFDPNNDTVGGTSWTSTSVTGETWTVNRSGTNAPADIASDLSVMNVTGLTAGGTAQLREIDAQASYVLPAPQALSATVPVKLGLAGMTNTFSAGSYTSVIKTLDSTSAAIDTSAASPAVAITAPVVAEATAPSPYSQLPKVGTSVDIYPQSVGVANGKLYVGDQLSSSIYVTDLGTGVTSVAAGSGATQNGLQPSVSAANANFWVPIGINVDSAGNVLIADNGGATIRKLSSGVVTTIAGTGIAGYDGDGVATARQTNSPTAVTQDPSGNVYYIENSQYIRKIDTSGNLSTVAGTGVAGNTGDGGPANAASIRNAHDLAISPDGTILYVADSGNNRVRRIDLSTGIITNFAGNGTAANGGDNGLATSANLSNPRGVAVAANGDLYITDSGNNRIRKVNVASAVISSFAGTGTGSFTGDGGPASAATFNYPKNSKFDESGNLFVTDVSNYRVRKIDTAGVVTTIVGSGLGPSSGDGGPLSASKTWFPQQLIGDSQGNLYVAEANGSVIRKVSPSGLVSTVAGLAPGGLAGYAGDGGPATAARFNSPYGIAFDPVGNMYIADTTNRRIRKVDTAGIVTNVALVTFTPRAIAFNPFDGTLLLGPQSNDCKAYKMNTDGTNLVAIAGTGTCGTSGDNGPATSANIGNIRGIAVDAAGNILLGDVDAGRIRKLNSSGTITTLAGGGTDQAENVQSTRAQLPALNGFTIGVDGTVYVSVAGKVRKFKQGGPVTTVVIVTGSSGVATVNGQIYAADYNRQRIFKVADAAPIAPLVNNDVMSVPMSTQRQWPILSNDWSRSGQMDPSSVNVVAQPTNGTVALSTPSTEAATMQAVYTPTTGYMGNDSFTYRACDTTRVTCGTATVNIVIGSNEVTTVAGGLTEGYAKDIGLKVVGHARSGRYVFITENGFNTIRRFDPYSGQLVVVAGSYSTKSDGGGIPATSGGFAQPFGLTFTPNGDMYVTDKNVIRKIATDGTLSTTAGNGTSSDTGDGGTALAAGFSSTKRLALGIDGTLYVTTDRAVRGISTNGIVNRVAGSYGASGFAGDGGPALSGLFNAPYGLSTNANGDIYVADVYNDRIRRISKGVITTVAGTGVHGYAAGPLATDAAFSYPYDVSVEASGQLLVADYGNFKVRRFTDGGNITDVAGGGAGGDGVSAISSNIGYALTVSAGANGDFYFSNDGGLAPRYVNTAGVISSPINGIRKASFAGDGFVGPQTQLNLYGFSGNLAADPIGNLYINDFAANRIRRLDASTKVMSTWAGDGSGLVASPTGQLTFDPNGNLVFIDNACRVRVRMPDGSTPVVAGNGTCGNTGDGGLASAAQINPIVGGLAFNAAGDLYIANKNTSTIRKVDNTTKIISNVAGDQVGGYTGDGGPASAARVNQPSNLQFDGAGNLYLADAGNSVIRMIDTSGIITTVSSGLSFPRSFVVDASGQLFVADANTNTIGKIGDKVQTLIAGNGLSGATDNVTALNSQFNAPTGLAVVGNDLYVADTGNHRIRKIAGVASSATNALASAKWSIVPGATGHANLRERFTFTTASAVTSSKITTTVPAGFAASTLAVVEAYGLSGTVTPSLSGTTLTLTFPAQALAAGVPISVSLEGVTSPGAVGNSASFTQLFDSAGTSVVGALRTNVVTQASASGPSVGAPGFGSPWKRALVTTPSAMSQVSVNPSLVTDANSSFTLTSAGTINGNTSSFAATSATASSYAFTAVTPNSSTSVSSAAFGLNRWGLQVTSSTGAAAASAGPGVYVGLSTTSAPLFNSLSATNVLTVNTRARVNYLQPAGTYKSTLTWRTSGGF